VAGALASIEALGRETSSEAYDSLLESLARLPRRMGTVPWKRRAEIRSSREANGCAVRFDTLELICRPQATTVFESGNYIVVSPDANRERAPQPVSNLQYWDVWHQDSFQKLNLAVPPRSALSPSGRYLATPEPDGVVTLREFPSGKEVFRLGSPIREPQSASASPADQVFRQQYSRAAAIQFSKDERYLITSVVRLGQWAYDHTEFSIWDLEARRSVSWYIGSERLEFSISPNRKGARYVFVSDGSVCRIPETPKSVKGPALPLRPLFQTPERSYARFFSEDGSKLMVVMPQSALLYRLPNDTASVFEHLDARTEALSPDGKLAAFELGDGLVRVFQTDSQKEVKRIVGEPRGEMRFEDNSHLLTSADQGAFRWGLSDAEVVATASRNSSVVGFSPEGDSIVTGRGAGFIPSESFRTSVAPDQSFSVFDLASTPPRQVFYGQGPRAFTLQFSADSAVLAAQIDQFPRVTILPLKEKGAARFISSTSEVLEGITPDVRYAAFGEPSGSGLWYRDRQLLKTGDVPPLRAALANETASVSGFLGFPDNNTIAGCTRGQAYRRDLRNPERAPLFGQTFNVNCDYAGVSADARFVLFRADSGPGVALWNTSDGTLARMPWSLPPLDKRPTLSLKGKFVFIPPLNEIWKVSSGETVFRGPSQPPRRSNQSEAVFAAGESLAAVGTYPRTSIVDLAKGGERCSIPPASYVSLIGFDANASHLFSSEMGRLKAWRTADCQLENIPNVSGSFGESGFTSPDGRFWVSTYAYRQSERKR
jgi:WD40 repeat protein